MISRKFNGKVVVMRAVIAPVNSKGETMYSQEMKCKPLSYPTHMSKGEIATVYCNHIGYWLKEMNRQGYRLLRLEREIVEIPDSSPSNGIPVSTSEIQLNLDI